MKLKTFFFLIIAISIFTFSANLTLAQGEVNCGVGYEEDMGACFPAGTNLPDSDVITIITNIMYWILGIFGFLAIIAFAISGIQYILSVGDEKSIDTAKRSMKWSIIGVVVALSGLVIIYAVDRMLRANSNF